MKQIQPLEPDFTKEHLNNEQIDEINMDQIDWYIEKKKEFNKKGYFTGFMDIKIYEEPPEPKFIEYVQGE